MAARGSLVGLAATRTATFPATTLIAFGSFNSSRRPTGPGAQFRFGSLDFTSNKVGILRPASSRTSQLIVLPYLPFGISNFATVAIKIIATKIPINDYREGAPRPQLPHELGPRLVGFLDEFVRLTDTETESSENTPTSACSPRDVFVVLHPETEAEKQEREEECRIKQRQEDLNWRMEELQEYRFACPGVLKPPSGTADHYGL
uniref:Uncharacterized protein n=1 Tax=Oryza punctata TaxID=4537 RepID=A0A0E0MLU8_ORYPU